MALARRQAVICSGAKRLAAAALAAQGRLVPPRALCVLQCMLSLLLRRVPPLLMLLLSRQPLRSWQRGNSRLAELLSWLQDGRQPSL